MIIITDDLHIIEIKPYYQILDKPTIIMEQMNESNNYNRNNR
jgi:hypothetical protein